MSSKNESIALKKNGKVLHQDKNSNRKKSFVQKKYAFNDITSPHLLKIENELKELMILCKGGINRFKVFKDNRKN